MAFRLARGRADKPERRLYDEGELVWGVPRRAGYDDQDDPKAHAGLTQHAFEPGNDERAICGFEPPKRATGPSAKPRPQLAVPTLRLNPRCPKCARLIAPPAQPIPPAIPTPLESPGDQAAPQVAVEPPTVPAPADAAASMDISAAAPMDIPAAEPGPPMDIPAAQTRPADEAGPVDVSPPPAPPPQPRPAEQRPDAKRPPAEPPLIAPTPASWPTAQQIALPRRQVMPPPPAPPPVKLSEMAAVPKPIQTTLPMSAPPPRVGVSLPRGEAWEGTANFVVGQVSTVVLPPDKPGLGVVASVVAGPSGTRVASVTMNPDGSALISLSDPARAPVTVAWFVVPVVDPEP